MDKKTGRYGLFAAAVLLIVYFSWGPIYTACSRAITFEKALTESEVNLVEVEGPYQEKKSSDAGSLNSKDTSKGTTIENESLPGDTGIFRRFLDRLDNLVKRIRKLVLGEG